MPLCESQIGNTIAGVIMIFLARVLLPYARTLRGGDAYYLAATSKKLIVYFRSFHDDSNVDNHGYRNFFWGIFIGRLTYEEQLVKALNKFGDVVAVANPKNRLLNRGAPRFKITKNTWPPIVRELMHRSTLSVFLLGYSDYIRNELAWARQILRPEQVLMHVPVSRWQTLVRYRGEGTTRSYHTFLNGIVSSIFGYYLDANQVNMCNFFWFKHGWYLRPLQALEQDKSSWFSGSYAKVYENALLPVREAIEKNNIT